VVISECPGRYRSTPRRIPPSKALEYREARWWSRETHSERGVSVDLSWLDDELITPPTPEVILTC
jgi:hypothetical protein